MVGMLRTGHGPCGWKGKEKGKSSKCCRLAFVRFLEFPVLFSERLSPKNGSGVRNATGDWEKEPRWLLAQLSVDVVWM